MKLYYAKGACSLAPHIALLDAGLPHQLVRVDLGSHRTEDGDDYLNVNPKGYVPTLVIDAGQRLTEAAVVLQYIADRKPGTLAPEQGTFPRYQLMEWLNFIATEIHKGFGPLWHPDASDASRAPVVKQLGKRFTIVEAALAQHPFLTGERFTIADAYLYTVTNWAPTLKVDLTAWPALRAFMARVASRPAVQRALQQEGLARAA